MPGAAVVPCALRCALLPRCASRRLGGYGVLADVLGLRVRAPLPRRALELPRWVSGVHGMLLATVAVALSDSICILLVRVAVLWRVLELALGRSDTSLDRACAGLRLHPLMF